MDVKSRLKNLMQFGYTLEQAIAEVVPGADVTLWRKLLAQPDKPPKKKAAKRTTSRSGPRKAKFYSTARIAGLGLVETLKRVNEKPVEAGNSWGGAPIPFDGVAPEVENWADDYGLEAIA